MSSRVGVFEFPTSGRSKLDLLFVIDSSTAMAPYREHLVMQFPRFADALTLVGGGMPDVNIAFASADFAAGGELRTSPRVDGAYIIDGLRDGVRVQNYTGDLGSLLAELADVGATQSAPPRPLDVVPLALAQADFVREHAYLAVVVVAATDDASTAAVQDVVAALKSMKSDPASVLAFGVYAAPAPRLDAFLAGFPNRATFTPIDAEDPSEGFADIVTIHRTTGGVPCIEWRPADVDPDTTGEQYDCVIDQRDYATGMSTILPRCGATSDLPCWDIETDTQSCFLDDHLRFVLDRGMQGIPYEGALIHGECVIE